MLKRQRAPSPAPCSSSFSELPPIEKMHDAKRRRVQPPVLDGRSRGWGNLQSSMPDQLEDHDYEDEDEDEEQNQGGNEAITCTRPPSPYKSANNFLHDLHVLHRHRQLFSSSHPSPFSPVDQRTSTSIIPSHHSDIYTENHTLRTHQTVELKPCFAEVNAGMPKEHASAEVRSVRERYEDTNRLLGSLVLSRRRELGYGVGDTGPGT